MNTTSIPRQQVVDDELLSLAVEIFATTYGLEWNAAMDLAVAQIDGLLQFAAEWDGLAAQEAMGDVPVLAA